MGNPHGISEALSNLGNVAALQGDYSHASDLFQQSLEISRQLGDQYGIALNLSNLGEVALRQGDYTRTTDLLQQSLNIFQQMGDLYNIAWTCLGLGEAALKQGGTQAASWCGQALRIAHSIQATSVVLESAVKLANVTLQAGDAPRAAQLVGLMQSRPAKHSEMQRELDTLVTELEAALTADELQAALEQGKSLDLDTVVGELLAEFGER